MAKMAKVAKMAKAGNVAILLIAYTKTKFLCAHPSA